MLQLFLYIITSVPLITCTENVFCGICTCIPEHSANEYSLTKIICANESPPLSRIYATRSRHNYDLYIESDTIYSVYVWNKKQFNTLFNNIYKLNYTSNDFYRIGGGNNLFTMTTTESVSRDTDSIKNNHEHSQRITNGWSIVDNWPIVSSTSTPSRTSRGSTLSSVVTNQKGVIVDLLELITPVTTFNKSFEENQITITRSAFGNATTMQVIIVVFLVCISCFIIFGLCYIPITICRRRYISRCRHRRTANINHSDVDDDEFVEMETVSNHPL